MRLTISILLLKIVLHNKLVDAPQTFTIMQQGENGTGGGGGGGEKFFLRGKKVSLAAGPGPVPRQLRGDELTAPSTFLSFGSRGLFSPGLAGCLSDPQLSANFEPFTTAEEASVCPRGSRSRFSRRFGRT